MITALVALLVLISLGLVVTVPVALATPGEWENSKDNFTKIIQGIVPASKYNKLKIKIWLIFKYLFLTIS